MKRKSRGQTLVEFALVFPLITVFLFASIDFGYWVFAWASTQYSARRGAEKATLTQPREILTSSGYHSGNYTKNDPCLLEIYNQMKKNGAFSDALTIQNSNINISFHNNAADTTQRTGNDAKKPGNIVQIRVTKAVAPLTPIAGLITSNFQFEAISRRTIVANGPSFVSVFTYGGHSYDYNKCTITPPLP